MFQSLSIERFRGFSKLELENLGRVNLILGANNTGKTSLLEAIALISNYFAIGDLHKTFRSFAPQSDNRTYAWLQQREAANGGRTELRGVSPDGTTRRFVIINERKDAAPDKSEGLQGCGGNGDLLYWRAKDVEPLEIRMIPVQHKSPPEMVDPYVMAVRAPEDEQQMESLLGSVDKRIRSVRLDMINAQPFIAVDIGLRERIPLAQSGQGVYRLVSIFSELLGNKPQICIIDEIENGIHYTALPTIWKGIAEVASRLDIQIFATTHSKECIEAAHEVFSEREPYDFRIIQLDRVKSGIVGRVLDQPLIEAGVEANIEMR